MLLAGVFLVSALLCVSSLPFYFQCLLVQRDSDATGKKLPVLSECG